MSLLAEITKLGLRKQTRKDSPMAIVRNIFNKSLNRAALVATRAKKVSGAVTIWEGASLLNGEPIKIVMSGFDKDSQNSKTGPLVQIYILPSDVNPRENYVNGGQSVCGDCVYNGDGGCYVNWARLTPTWKSSKKKHVELDVAEWLCTGLRIRVGAAGDPAAVPTWIWQKLLSGAESWTGYTHQWRNCDPTLKTLFMASCDTAEDRDMAQRLGWNVFYVHEGEEDQGIACPGGTAKAKPGEIPKTCFSCMLCHGIRSKHAKPIVVTEVVHGATNTINKAKQARSK